ncbi:MAG: hypothetical protein ACR2G7_09145 [Acidimicrobiales bacterium]
MVVVAAVAVQLCLCILGGRALSTALSGVLRSRRGRDLTALATVLVAVVVPQSFRLFGDVERSQVDAVARAVAWTPPGLAARAVVDARAGELVSSLAALGASTAVAGALAWWWMAGLDRSLTTA